MPITQLLSIFFSSSSMCKTISVTLDSKLIVYLCQYKCIHIRIFALLSSIEVIDKNRCYDAYIREHRCCTLWDVATFCG